MKKSIILLISFLLAFNFSIQSLVAQTNDNQLYTIRTIKVEPAKRAAFEKALTTANAAFKAAKVSNLEYYINSTFDYDYYAAVPIENMAEMDKSYWAEAISKMGREKFVQAVAPVEEHFSESHMDIYVHRKDWNYQHPSLKDTPTGYRKWHLYQFKSGASPQVEALMKEWIALLKQKDIVRSQSFFQGVIGPKEGTIVSLIDAKDAASFAQQEAKFWGKVGAEGRALWEKTEALLVKIETREGRFRPDLSMYPSTVTKEETAKKE